MSATTVLGRRLRAAGSVLLLAVCFPSAAAVLDPEVVSALDVGGDGAPLAVIVMLSGPAEAPPPGALPTDASRRRAALVTRLHARFEAARRAPDEVLSRARIPDAIPLWAINGIAVSAPPQVIEELAVTPGVKEIRLDRVVREPEASRTLAAAEDWNLERVRADEVWAMGYTGEGVVVASLDSGVDLAHRQLTDRWRGGDNSWFDPSGEHATPADTSGHGTQVTGLMMADGTGGSVIGVAPGARWIAAKIFDDDGEASLSGIHRAFQWLLDPDGVPATDDAPQVVNGSFGFPELAGQCFDEFAPDIALLRQAGIAVVFSAGNAGPAAATSVSPANNPGAFAVGGTDQDDAVAPFSSRGPSACGGPFPAVAAPAVALRTTDRTFGGVFPDAFAYVTGTSFAAPEVSGAMALLLSAYPEASPEQLESALTAGAVDLDSAGTDDASGSGRLDIAAALAALVNLVNRPQCTDADGDGFFAARGCGTAADCDDADPSVYPGAWDWPYDGIDQDCDGRDPPLRPVPTSKAH